MTDPLNQKLRRKPSTSPGVLMLLVVIFLVLALFVGFQLTQLLPTTETLTRPTNDIRLLMYSQIRTGMTYSEVRQILGRAGTEMSHVQLAGYTTVMYSWTNPDGSNMNVTLQNDRIIGKAQFGLK